MNHIHLQALQNCQHNLAALEKMVSIKYLKLRIEEIDADLNNPTLWDHPQKAANLLKERKKLSEIDELLSQSKSDLDIYAAFIQSNELSEEDYIQLTNLQDRIQASLFKEMMQDPADNTPAILSITAGAGGFEAANWVTMMLRMYLRYADAAGFKTEIIDEKRSVEHTSICIDSVTIRIDGPYAFGFFKGESGVHRLIRCSPFNAAGARQTSFAAVHVSPDIEDTIDIKIDEKDLEITAMRAGGAGGQHQNKVNSAIRLIYKPAGINIAVRSERDQHENRRIAIKMLKAKLYEIELKKKQDEKDKQISAMTDVSFGNQIRTYTLMPYKLVKDHRTEFESSDADAVLDGNIKDFMISFLQKTIDEKVYN